MIKLAVLCASVMLAVTSLANAVDSSPECALSNSELEKMKELTYKGTDGEELLMKHFTEVWGTQTVYDCFGTYVKRSEEDEMLQQVTIGKLLDTDKQIKVKHYLQKIEPNVYLVIRGDKKPIGRLYILHASNTLVATFQCALERGDAVKKIFSRMSHHLKEGAEQPDDDLPPKYAVILAPISAFSFAPSEAKVKEWADTHALLKDNERLFGTIRDPKHCTLHEHDFEYTSVKPSN